MSELRANTISDAAGTGPVTLTGQYAAKAWVTYDQTTPTVDDSENISSVTDNSVGSYTVSFSNGFSNTNYCGVGSGDLDPGGFTAGAIIGVDGTKSTGSVQMAADNVSATQQDRRSNIQWLGDLA